VQPAWFVEQLDAQGRVDKYVINPKAENLNIVGERAVYELLDGRTQDEIDADLMNRVTILQRAGRCSRCSARDPRRQGRLQPIEGLPIYVGLDFGRRPPRCSPSSGRPLVRAGRDDRREHGRDDFAPMVKRLAA
jgi:hypothetical protein